MSNKRANVLEPLLTIPEVARICRVSDKTIRRRIKCNELPAIRLGGQWRIERGDLEAYIGARRWRCQ